MLKDGFGPDLKKIFAPLARKAEKENVQYIMATATLTAAVKRLMEEENFPKTRFLEANDAHKSNPSLKQVMIDTKGVDKVQMVLDLLHQEKKDSRVMVFCNTVNSCRALEHAMREVGMDSLCYHGDVNSEERKVNLQKFKDGETRFLVCTDIAARGLDMPFVEHVVMFDFPLNPVDYLHRYVN